MSDFSKNLARTDEPPGRYINMSRNRIGRVDEPAPSCGWLLSDCTEPAVAICVVTSTTRFMVVNDFPVCRHHADWIIAARNVGGELGIVEVTP